MLDRTKIITRFAPSPTGSLHLGGARTALYNWLFARRNNGTFILRIEDTDLERSTDEAAKEIIESLHWLGLDWDKGPYFQSKRMPIYIDHLNQLREKGVIYPAFETKEELEAIRQKAISEKRNPIYDRSALNLSKEMIQEKMDKGETFVWRFKVPDAGFTIVPEYLMSDGSYRVKNDTIGDFVITRPGTKANPGMPLYNFVCTIDDALMDITHVIRGIEHLPNTPKQILLYQSLGYSLPKFYHLPLITKHGKKMSKRDKHESIEFPVSVLGRRALGYLPEATINHLALLGWSPPDAEELFSIDKLIKEFGVDRLSKSNANFDEDKYLFINAHHLKKMPDKELFNKVIPFFNKSGLDVSKFSLDVLNKIIAVEKSRCKKLIDFPETGAYFFSKPTVYDETGIKKFFETPAVNTLLILESAINQLKVLERVNLYNVENFLKRLVEDIEIPLKKVGPVIRLALTGKTSSPSLVEVIDILGKTETIERLQAAINFITQKNK